MGEVLPAGWARTTLGEITASKVERSGPDPRSDHFVYVDIGSIGSAKSISVRQVVPTLDAPSRARQKLKAGDVLVSMTRPNLNAVALVPTDFDGAIGSTGFHVLRSQIVDPRYLFALVRGSAFVGAMTELVQGALYPAVRPDDLRGFEVALPPAPEQKRIVAKIEELTARSWRAKNALDAVPPLLDQLRQSILAAAFRGDLTADWRAKNPDVEPAEKLLARIRAERRRRWEAAEIAKMTAKSKSPTDDAWKARYGEPTPIDMTDLPDLPPGWCWASTSEVCTDVVDCHNKTAPYVESGVPLIRTTNIRNGWIDLTSTKFVDEPTYAFWSRRCPPKPGDIIFTREAPMGEAGMVPPNTRLCMGQRMMLLRADDAMLRRRFLLYAVQAPHVFSYAERLSVGTGVQHLRVGDVEALPIPIAPVDEQTAIAEAIDAAFAKHAATESALHEVLISLDRMDQATLAKAFRGELVPQDPNDEPASALLDRIRATRDTAEPAGSQASRYSGTTDATEDSDDQGDENAVMPIRLDSARVGSKDLSGTENRTLIDEVFVALWTLGPIDKEEAVRRVADHLRRAGYVRFERLRADGPLFGQVLEAIESAVKDDRLDRPKRGYVRACKADAETYTADDWRHALVASLGITPTDREEAIRAAAEWARDNLGLEFTRLRGDGHIVEGLRSAINSAIRRGDVIRHDATQISRAGAAQAALLLKERLA